MPDLLNLNGRKWLLRRHTSPPLPHIGLDGANVVMTKDDGSQVRHPCERVAKLALARHGLRMRIFEPRPDIVDISLAARHGVRVTGEEELTAQCGPDTAATASHLSTHTSR